MNDNLIETIENGQKKSPKLPDGLKNYLIDIDGVISEDCANEDIERMRIVKEIPDAKEKINQLFDRGNIITLFSSRTAEEHKEITETWLKERGFKYHAIIFNKPRGGNYVFIDDRGLELKTKL